MNNIFIDEDERKKLVKDIIELSGLHPLKVRNIYAFGSQIYGTAKENSDFDFILVGCAGLAKDEKKSGKLNVHIHTTDAFKDDLFKHDVHNLECFYSPEWAKLQVKEPYEKFTLDPKKVKQSFLTESANSWHGAKMKMRDGNIRYGIKGIWHSIRMLSVGAQLAEFGRIDDFSAMNYLYYELNECSEYEWDFYKRKYLPLKIELENKLKGVNTL